MTFENKGPGRFFYSAVVCGEKAMQSVQRHEVVEMKNPEKNWES